MQYLVGTRHFTWEGNGNPLQLLLGESHGWRSLVGYSPWVAESRTWLSDFTFTFHFHALEKEMATHSSILAWRIPGTEELVGLPSMGLHRVRHDRRGLAAAGISQMNLLNPHNNHVTISSSPPLASYYGWESWSTGGLHNVLMVMWLMHVRACVKTRKPMLLISMFFCFHSFVVDLFFFLNFKKSFILDNTSLCDCVLSYRFFF